MLVSLGANSPGGVSLAPPSFGSWVGRCFCDDGFLSLGRELGLAKELLCNQALASGGEGGKGAEGEEEVFWLLHAAAAATLWRWEVTEGGGRGGGTTCCDDQGDAGEGERENDPKRRCVLLAAPLPPFLHLLLPTSRPGWSHIRRRAGAKVFPHIAMKLDHRIRALPSESRQIPHLSSSSPSPFFFLLPSTNLE